MSVTLTPAMCRRHLLTEAQRAQFETILTFRTDRRIAAITLKFYNDGDTLYGLGSPYLLTSFSDKMQSISPSSFGRDLDPDGQKLLQDMVYDMLEDSWLAQQLEEIDGDYELFPATPGIYTLYIFEGCAICSVEFPDSLAVEQQSDIKTGRADLGLRSRLCTIILTPTLSNHAALAQPALVDEALRFWKASMQMGGGGYSHEFLTLECPSPSDIAAVTTDAVA